MSRDRATSFLYSRKTMHFYDGSMLRGRQDAPIMGELLKKATFFRSFHHRLSALASSLLCKCLLYSSLSKVSLIVQKRNFEITPFQTFFQSLELSQDSVNNLIHTEASKRAATCATYSTHSTFSCSKNSDAIRYLKKILFIATPSLQNISHLPRGKHYG